MDKRRDKVSPSTRNVYLQARQRTVGARADFDFASVYGGMRAGGGGVGQAAAAHVERAQERAKWRGSMCADVCRWSVPQQRLHKRAVPKNNQKPPTLRACRRQPCVTFHVGGLKQPAERIRLAATDAAVARH